MSSVCSYCCIQRQPTLSASLARKEVLRHKSGFCEARSCFQGCHDTWKNGGMKKCGNHACFIPAAYPRNERHSCGKIFWSREPRSGIRLWYSRIRGWNQLHSLPAPQEEVADVAVVQDYLQRIYSSMGLHEYAPEEHMVLTGKQLAWGMEGDWNMTWCMDGRFHEQFRSKDFTHEWAYDGVHSWYADAGGRVIKQELDCHEVCLLISWIRTGYWLTDDAQRHLDIQLGTHHSVDALDSQLVLAVRMKNKKVVAYIVVDKNTWLPAGMFVQAFGGTEKWSFSAWKNILPGRSCKLPSLGVHVPPTGSPETCNLSSVEVADFETINSQSIYSYPLSLVVPRHNLHSPRSHIDSSCPSAVPMKISETGHFLVQPLVDGKHIGVFIVDTGASNLGISAIKAKELGMYKFGEVFVSGVSGMARSRFARGKTFQLGRFKMTDPAFLEVPIDELLSGVVGICGYEIFFGSIVEMSVTDRMLSLFEPSEYETLSHRKNLQWQKMYLFEGIPHVTAKVNGEDVLLLLDTGAGGTDLIFYSKTGKHFNLPQSGSVKIKGINTEGVEMTMAGVDSLEFCGYAFQNVTAYLIDERDKPCVTSEYCSGVLCGRIVQNFLMVFDYSKGRMALVDQGSPRLQKTRSSSFPI